MKNRRQAMTRWQRERMGCENNCVIGESFSVDGGEVSATAFSFTFSSSIIFSPFLSILSVYIFLSLFAQ